MRTEGLVAAPRGHRLNPKDVIYILQSPDIDGVVAQRLGVSRQAVSSVRLGRSYAKVAPQLPRRESTAPYTLAGVTCLDCNFWNGHGCVFGFPEPVKDMRFAQECSMYALEKGLLSLDEGGNDDD